jgi:Phage integrase family
VAFPPLAGHADVGLMVVAERLSIRPVVDVGRLIPEALTRSEGVGFMLPSSIEGGESHGIAHPKRRPLHGLRFKVFEVYECSRTGDRIHRNTHAYTGIRVGEAAALRRVRCDILHRRLLISESLAEVNGRLIVGDTKNHQKRKVVLPDFLRAPFEDHLASQVRAEKDALVFTGPDGGPLRYSNFRTRYWLPAISEAELAPLRIHDLRHTFASLAASNAASIKLVQVQLGHSDPALTLRLYEHLFPDDLDVLAARLDETYRIATTPKIPRPDRGLEIVPDVDGETDGAAARTFGAPPAGFEPATHGLGNRRSIL